MNPVYMLGKDPEVDNTLGLLQPSQNKRMAYNYYWNKLYALVTNLFKWEIKTSPLFPDRYMEIIFNTKGSIMFAEAFIKKGAETKSLGYVAASYSTQSSQLDFFGQETQVRMQPYNTSNNSELSTNYLVMNSLNTDLDTREESKNSKINKCVLGFNTHLRESIEWLPYLCAKLALLDCAIITNVNLLKQPLTIVADERTDFSADNLVENYNDNFNILKIFSGAGQELLNSLKVHSTGAENYISTYEVVKDKLLKEAYERMGISTNVVDKKERVLQSEQLSQNAVSNLIYAEKWEMRQKFIDDIKRVFPDVDITCTPILSLPKKEEDDEATMIKERNEDVND